MTALLATTMSTPAGPLSMVIDTDTLVAAGFTDDPERLRGRLDPIRRAMPLARNGPEGAISDALTAYFDGELEAVRTIPVEQVGGPFTRRAWAALREVPAGETVTYTELAARAGSATAVRAAGSACARNLIAPVVPCHRVVRTDGCLGGYAYGIEVKRRLLDHERRHQR